VLGLGNILLGDDGIGVQVAQRICADCPVSEACLQYALEERVDHGVWGGKSERERKRLRRVWRDERRGSKVAV